MEESVVCGSRRRTQRRTGQHDQIDTTQAATDTVQYVVTDQNGLTATSTRTVIVEPAQPSSQAVTTTQLSLAAPATSTAATSTAQ
jgi:hypothetical protein